MIIRIRRHPANPATAVLACGADANALMGRFGPARLSPADHGYLLAEAAVPDLLRFLTHHGVTALDERGEAPDESRAKFTGPLPQCGNPDCGLPAPRKAAAVLRFCPACGRPWAPVTPGFTLRELGAHTECGSCQRRQGGVFAHCSDCGGPMVQVVTGKRPSHVPPRPSSEPVLFGAAIDTAEELERDHMQRAAGDR